MFERSTGLVPKMLARWFENASTSWYNCIVPDSSEAKNQMRWLAMRLGIERRLRGCSSGTSGSKKFIQHEIWGIAPGGAIPFFCD